MLAVPVRKRLAVLRAFDANTLPMTWRFAVGARVPNPTRPEPLVTRAMFEESMRT
jgi:hypothetical protein